MSDLLNIAQAATAKAEADAKRIAELETEVQRLKTKISTARRRLYALIESIEETAKNVEAV
jgi:predicted  nucleic acid-binding Zn-ribbon protein